VLWQAACIGYIILSAAPYTAPTERVELHNLDQKLVRGIAWTGIAKWSSQLVTWATTILVARLLSPADYGLVAMSTLFLGLINQLSEFGIGATIVAKKDLSQQQVAQLNSVSVIMGLICASASAAASIPISRFFSDQRLILVVVAMSSGFLISSFQVVPYSLLQKDLRFKLLAGIEATRSVGAGLISLLLAAVGFGYWALVLPNLLSALIGTILFVLARPHGFARPRKDCQRAVNFGSHIALAGLAWYVVSNADFLVAGKLLGQAATGAYVLAWYIASTPVEKITALLSRVGPAFFSAVQDERAAVRRYLFGLSDALVFLTFPASVGLALVADDLVNTGFGPKWHAAIVPLRLLAIAATYRSITPLLNFVLNVLNDTKYAMWNSAMCAVILPLGYLIGSRWNVAGIALIWAVVFPLVKWPMFKRVFQQIDTDARNYLRLLQPTISSCLLMSAAVLAFRIACPSTLGAGKRLVIEVLIGSGAYVCAALTVYGNHTREAYRVMKRVFAQPVA